MQESVSVYLQRSSSVRVRACHFFNCAEQPKMKLSMDVVCAVIKSADVINKGRNDLFLIAKHAKNKIHAGKWEFPGGKVKHEENHSDAVKREVIEELCA